MAAAGRPDQAGPPATASALLRRMLAEGDRDSVSDELAELHAIRCARDGRAAASRWYVRQVCMFAWQLARHGRRRGVDPGRSAFRAAMDRTDDRRRGGRMGRVANELGQTVRRLARARMFTVVSVLTIGVGIGAFTSIFGLVEAVLIEPMPYDDPDELVWVWRDYVGADFPRGWLSGPDIAYLEEQGDVIEAIVAFRSGGLNLSGLEGTDPVSVLAHYASPGFFDLLGVRTALGRGFTPEDGFEGAPPVAVISDELWTASFGADPDVIGRMIRLSDESVEVIGVAPEGFRFVKHGSLSDPLEADLYMPLALDLAAADPSSGSFAALARIRPGTSPERLDAALAAAATPVNQALADQGATLIRLWSIGLEEDLVAPIRAALIALVASAGFLLLMLAANLTTLLLGRAATRQREVAVRMALGAGRGSIVAGVMAESSVIAGLGGLVGFGLAFLGTDVVIGLAPETMPRLASVGLDGSVLGIAILTTVVMALGAALVPAFHAARAPIAGAMGEGGGRGGGSVGISRARGALVATQVALSFMLLAGGVLVARAFSDLVRDDPGFDSTSTMTFRVPLPGALYSGAEGWTFHMGLLDRIGAIPGVTGAGATTALPLTQLTNQRGVSFPGAPGNGPDERENAPLIDWFRVTPGYFDAAGLRLLEGRDFNSSDADTTTISVVIDDVLAERFFPDGSAVGGQVSIFGETATIVGVVDQARLYSVHSDDRGQVYVPFERFPTTSLSYAVRTTVPPTSILPAVRAAAADLDASVPIAQPLTLEEIVGESLGSQRLSLTLIVTFALGALLLATLGIYGVVANSVVRRTQEIGVRMALGAGSDGVVRLVLGQGLRVTLLGALLGLVGALLATRLLEGVMVGVRPGDPVVYVAVGLALLAVAQLASYLPARRATRIDPIEALRP